MKAKAQQRASIGIAKKVLFWDRVMNRIITVGGIGIIVAVLAIFVFILTQVGPLFLGAKVEKPSIFSLSGRTFTHLGLDEWGERPFLVQSDGSIQFVDFKEKPALLDLVPPFQEAQAMVFQFQPETQTLLYMDPKGRLAFAEIQYEMNFSNGDRQLNHAVKTTPWYDLSSLGKPISKIIDAQFGDGKNSRLVAGIVERDGARSIEVLRLNKEEDLLGETTLKAGPGWDLTVKIEGTPEKVRINESGDVLLVSTREGKIFYFRPKGDDLELQQIFEPFAHQSSREISSIDFLLGGVSVLLSNSKGKNILYSLFIPEDEENRRFGKIQEFPPLPGPVHSFSKSLRNKAFLVASKNKSSLRYGTTGKIRWEEEFPENIQQVTLNRKYNRIAVLDGKNQLGLYKLNDAHPEGSLKTFFGKIWYEGGSEPEYVWQSSGGSDASESKLSLIPLIVGTFKGTFFALLFSVPIALLAAVYTSQFLHPNLKKIVKPTMEIMASFPSVILGFLAALWLAPLIEDKVPSILMGILIIPAVAFLFGWMWERLPKWLRAKVPEGQEWLAFLPILLVALWGAWQLGPLLERYVFVVADASTGEKIPDFRLWWGQLTGTPFEQRNSLVVGFIMGFAVIPIIFTISEDSLSAVPPSLSSASLALGASRWQTAYRVVLPAAMAGIFSAIMIGFGRAVGETMIVLMATGNTPLVDFNIFTGMRTLSANLAVELPEAPYQGTLYRTLFLGALLLFLMTFSVNSIAEITRQRIRKKFKAL